MGNGGDDFAGFLAAGVAFARFRAKAFPARTLLTLDSDTFGELGDELCDELCDDGELGLGGFGGRPPFLASASMSCSALTRWSSSSILRSALNSLSTLPPRPHASSSDPPYFHIATL